MRRLLTVMVATLLALASTGIAAAQDYPTRPITMIVPFPAGGATDTLARFLAERMRGIFGQPVSSRILREQPAASASAAPFDRHQMATR